MREFRLQSRIYRQSEISIQNIRDLLSDHSGKFAFPAPEIVIPLHQNILHWLYATPEISGTTDKRSTKAI